MSDFQVGDRVYKNKPYVAFDKRYPRYDHLRGGVITVVHPSRGKPRVQSFRVCWDTTYPDGGVLNVDASCLVPEAPTETEIEQVRQSVEEVGDAVDGTRTPGRR